MEQYGNNNQTLKAFLLAVVAVILISAIAVGASALVAATRVNSNLSAWKAKFENGFTSSSEWYYYREEVMADSDIILSRLFINNYDGYCQLLDNVNGYVYRSGNNGGNSGNGGNNGGDNNYYDDSSQNSSYTPVEPAPYTQQKITVTSNGSNATLVLSEYIDGGWTNTFSCQARVGEQGVSSNVSEQTKATPRGTFNILFAFGQGGASTGLKYKTVTSDTIWIDDPNSAYYNTWQSKNAGYADWSSYESIYNQFSSGRSTLCIAFDFNGDCLSARSATPNRGSVIFIDGKPGALSATYGDIAISSSDMATLAYMLKADKHPTITIS